MGARKIKLLLAYYLFTFALGSCMTLESDALAQSLLKGATPSNFTVPSGWQTYYTQNFEGGLNGPGEFTYNGASLQTTRVHGGAKSLGGLYSATTGPGWGMETIPTRDIYVSFWEYIDSSFRLNDEFFIFRFYKNNPIDEVVTEFFWDQNGTFNSTQGRMTANCQGNVDHAYYTAQSTIPVGQWNQWEAFYHPNDPTSSGWGTGTGTLRVYLNGFLYRSWENTTLNGTRDMNGLNLLVGGTYSKLIWRRADNSCGASIGDGTTPPPIICQDWNNCSCPPNVPSFNRYYDDIIVMIRTGTADTTPPIAPTQLTVK